MWGSCESFHLLRCRRDQPSVYHSRYPQSLHLPSNAVLLSSSTFYKRHIFYAHATISIRSVYMYTVPAWSHIPITEQPLKITKTSQQTYQAFANIHYGECVMTSNIPITETVSQSGACKFLHWQQERRE